MKTHQIIITVIISDESLNKIFSEITTEQKEQRRAAPNSKETNTADNQCLLQNFIAN